MLSMNKDFRIVIADTYQVAEKELNDFAGNGFIREFLEQIITNCCFGDCIFAIKTKYSKPNVDFEIKLCSNTARNMI